MSTVSVITFEKTCCSVASALVNWQAKNSWNSYLIKWSDGEKEQDRQEEEAAVVAATQKRKMLCKTSRGKNKN